MPDLTERVIRVETRLDEQDRKMDYLRVEIIELRRSMEALSAELRAEMATLRTELRTEMATLRSEVSSEIAALRDSFDRRFTWLVGLQVAGLIAVIAALLQNSR